MMLSKDTCRNLLAYLGEMNKKSATLDSGSERKEQALEDPVVAKENTKTNTEKLQVCTIKGLNGYIFYDAHAYHISLLRQFIDKEETKKQNRPGLSDASKMNMSVHGSNVFKSMTKKSKGNDSASDDNTKLNMSVHRSMRF